MDSSLTTAAAQPIVVRNDDTQTPNALPLQAAASIRPRKPRRSRIARPLGVQIRDNYPLFRVR